MYVFECVCVCARVGICGKLGPICLACFMGPLGSDGGQAHTHAPCSLQRSICYGGRHTHTHTQPPKGCRSGSNDINGTSHVRCLCGNAAPAEMVAQGGGISSVPTRLRHTVHKAAAVQLGSSFLKRLFLHWFVLVRRRNISL